MLYDRQDDNLQAMWTAHLTFKPSAMCIVTSGSRLIEPVLVFVSASVTATVLVALHIPTQFEFVTVSICGSSSFMSKRMQYATLHTSAELSNHSQGFSLTKAVEPSVDKNDFTPGLECQAPDGACCQIHCLPLGNERPDFALDADAATVLQKSPCASRLEYLARVSQCLHALAEDLHGSSGHAANAEEPRGDTPCTIFLSELVSADTAVSGAAPTHRHEYARTCRTGFTDEHLWDLLQFVPWSALQVPSHDIEGYARFDAWIQAGKIGQPPLENEVLVITSDASFQSTTGRAGWGVVFSSKSTPHAEKSTFRGCAYGNVNQLLHEAGQSSVCPDAHLAETAGLMWAAIGAFQLRARQDIVFECDCQSALESARGAYRTREHVLGLASRALHASLAFYTANVPSYQWVQGHAGLVTNELADALAEKGSAEAFLSIPFRLDVASWFSQQCSALRWVSHGFWAKRFPDAAPGHSCGQLCWHEHMPGLKGPAEDVIEPFLSEEVRLQQPSAEQGWTCFPLGLATYNVLSIVEPKNGGQPRATGLHAEVGRVKMMERCLIQHGIALAGLQEARSPEGQARCGRYARICTGPDQHSNYGCELWFDVESTFGTGAMSLRFAVSQVTVLHSEPTCLICRLRNSVVDWQILCLHGPHRARTEQCRTQWWTRVGGICRSVDVGGCWIVFMDGNLRLGSEVSQAVGGHQADVQDEAGELAHALMLDLRAFFPSTFEDVMEGPGATLFQKRGSQADRSDYIGIPQAWQPLQMKAFVEPSINVGHKCVDHMALVVKVQLMTLGKKPPSAQCWGISAPAIRDPANRAQIAAILREVPNVSWDVNVHEHVAVVTKFLQHRLHALFPVEKRRLRASFFTDRTASLHRTLGEARRMLRMRHRALRNTAIRCAFSVWKNMRHPVAFAHLFQGRWLGQLRCHLAVDTWRVAELSKLLRNSCRPDKASFAAMLADELADAPEQAVHAAYKGANLGKTSPFLACGWRMAPTVKVPWRLRTDGGGTFFFCFH